jgi:hypothetical protein
MQRCAASVCAEVIEQARLAEVRVIRAQSPSQRRLFRELIAGHHYLGYRTPVIASRGRMPPRTLQAGEWIEGLKDYLSNHRARIHYHKLKRGGLPRGSSAMDSTNKLIAHVRLTRPGVWWLRGKCD